MKHIPLSIPLILGLTTSVQSQQNIMLYCTYGGTDMEFVILINSEDGQAVRVDAEPSETCKLTTSPNFFEWDCKGNEKYWPSSTKVNRYTGKFEKEHGSEPFWKIPMTIGNLHNRGTCTADKPKKLF